MLHLISALGLQVVGQDYSRPGAQEEVFRLKVRRVREQTRRGSVYKANIKVREKLVRRILQQMFHEPFQSARPEWCRNPKSNRLLEIDCFSERLKLCVEVDGIHHVKFNHWHKTWKDFEMLQWRDKLKDRLAKEAGYKMIRVPPMTVVPCADLEVYLMRQLAGVL